MLYKFTFNSIHKIKVVTYDNKTNFKSLKLSKPNHVAVLLPLFVPRYL